MQIFDVLNGTKYMKGDEEKVQWTQIGAIFKKDDNKLSGKISAIPLNWDGQFIVRERKQREG